jgi:acyl-CoA dehydrogenase
MADQDLVVETVRDILTRHDPFELTAQRRWDERLWGSLAAAGLTGVGAPERSGGSGGELADAVAVVRTLAAGAGAVPAAEHLLVALPALLAAGLPLPDPAKPLGVALSGSIIAEPAGGQWRLSGTAVDVAWAGVLAHVVVAAAGPDGPVLGVVAGGEADYCANLAGEPRGSMKLDERTVLHACAVDPEQVALLRARFALARAVQLAAAMEQVLAWTLQYAGERCQFGRPIGRFQAIQMELAVMAGEVAGVTALTDAAVQALDRGENAMLAAAAAKVRAGAAVEVVARRAHQVHGAIGFTQEYRLHRLTRRLWSWRDEGGNEAVWADVLGAGLAADDPSGVWSQLTRVV